MKGLKMVLMPEVLAKMELSGKPLGIAWKAIDLAGYEDCLDDDGSLVVTVLIGEPDTEELKKIKLGDIV